MQLPSGCRGEIRSGCPTLVASFARVGILNLACVSKDKNPTLSQKTATRGGALTFPALGSAGLFSNIRPGSKDRLGSERATGCPSRIHIPYRIYSIHSTFILVEICVNHAKTALCGFGGRIALA